MNDEIKEILDDLLFTTTLPNVSIKLNKEKLNQLKDYITNLQQENERLKEKSINEVLRNDFDMCVKDLKKANKKIEKLEDYKSRNEKAVEYIQNCPEYLWENVNTKELLNILNVRSDE